eukprot:g19652.t1
MRGVGLTRRDLAAGFPLFPAWPYPSSFYHPTSVTSTAAPCGFPQAAVSKALRAFPNSLRVYRGPMKGSHQPWPVTLHQLRLHKQLVKG